MVPPSNPFTLNGYAIRYLCIMNGMAEDYYDVWLDMLGRGSTPLDPALALGVGGLPPGPAALVLDRAGVTLDLDLFQYVVHLDLRGPIGVLELAELVDQNHPKVSRSLA